MYTIKDITDYLRSWYRELWCGSIRLTCNYCKYEDNCIIFCYAVHDMLKGGEYH